MHRMRAMLGAVVLGAAISPAQADEGMWTFNNVPADRIAASYGFKPDQTWLDRVRLSSLRLAGGCSAAFVSPRGLVQTNHHCARDCIQEISTPEKDFIAAGFYAREDVDEIKCPGVEVNQLVDITDVTKRISKAIAGKDGPAFADAMKAEKAGIARECSGNDDNVRCDVIDLYNGGVYNLYRYRRYQDVRLVFAPEVSIAFFGGDPDNFEFPRYNLDVTYLRVYADGRPLDSSANSLRYAKADVQPGDLVFTSGHPGSTNRLDTVAELEFKRDVSFPRWIFETSELRGLLTEFSNRGPEHERIAKWLLYSTENGLKAAKGEFYALVDSPIIKDRMAAERSLRARIDADPTLRAQYERVWDDIRTTLERARKGGDERNIISGGFESSLFSFARILVRYPVEARKSDEARITEYTDANFPALRQSLLSDAPIYPELEKLTLTFSLTKMREALGPDHPYVRKTLGKQSPAQLAAELIDRSGLANGDVRKRLLDGGQAAIDASTDPMIAFVRTIDDDMRAARKDKEDNIDAPLKKYSGQLAQVMFQIHGTSSYPDATFTLRLSYGSVAGYQQDAKVVPPITTIGGLFERATGAEPYKLPDSWIAAQASLNPRQAFNFVTTNDTVGGNSGSPMINKAGEIVGLYFDGNMQSHGGKFGYDGAANRSTGVNVGALREALSKVYRAERLLRELEN